jgi:hypothetical protein
MGRCGALGWRSAHHLANNLAWEHSWNNRRPDKHGISAGYSKRRIHPKDEAGDAWSIEADF